MVAIAKTWKSKINENAKCQAFYNEFPDLDHNELVRWTPLKGDDSVVIIEDQEDHPIAPWAGTPRFVRVGELIGPDTSDYAPGHFDR